MLLVINILRDWVTVSNRNHYKINVSNPKPFKLHLGGGRDVVGCSRTLVADGSKTPSLSDRSLDRGAGGVAREGEGQNCREFDFGSNGIVFSGDTSKQCDVCDC